MSDAIALDERAQVGEQYFLDCYPVAIAAALGLCGVAATVALVDQGPQALGTLAVIGILAVFAIGCSCTPKLRDRCYRALRGQAYVLATPALLAVPLASLWPSVDQNALYFAVAGPIAIIICVAQGPRDGFGAVLLIAAATVAAAALDRAEPGLSSLQQLSTATIGLIVSAVLLKVVVQWSALVVQEGAYSLAEAPPSQAPSPPAQPVEPRTAPVASRPPLTALALAVAEEIAAWMSAIREVLGGANARSRVWSEITGFQARELQVLLLLHVHDAEDVASYLSIKVSTVRNTASRAVSRERQGIVDPEAKASFTQADLSRELAERYPTRAELDADSGAVDTRRAYHREYPWR